jgi:hypothetical protein
MIWWIARVVDRYLLILVSVVCGRKKELRGWRLMGRQRWTCFIRKGLSRELTLKLRTEEAVCARSLQEEGRACGVNSWCVRSERMPRDVQVESGMKFER